MSRSNLVNQFLDNRDPILGFILALTRDHDVAEEIFQEVAKVILEEANQSTHVDQFMPWAREIARRRVAEFYRKQARQNLVERPTSGMEAVICQAFEENERILETTQLRFKALLECRQRLSGRSLELIEKFYRDRIRINDIAASVGWTANSVKAALWRIRKTLADCIRTKLRSWGETS